MAWIARWCAAALAACLSVMPLQALAETRVALIIGNTAYQGVGALPNPRKDAALLADALRRTGFRVRVETDLNGEAMRRALRDFAADAEQADWAVVYFAGHGLEMGGQNYLVPIDARLQVDRDVPFETVALDQVLQSVDGAKKLRLVIVDACRNNPFVTQMRTSATRSMERGLARVEPEGGTLVAYAAKVGQVALDGDGQNSPFVTALVKAVNTQGMELNKVFRAVRDDVLRDTGRRQEPYVYGSLPAEDFYFMPPSGTSQAPLATRPGDDTRSAEQAVQGEFLLARNTGTLPAWDAFLARHEKGFYADLARTERERLAALRPTPPAPERAPAGGQSVAAPAAGPTGGSPSSAAHAPPGSAASGFDLYLRSYAGGDCFAARPMGLAGSTDPSLRVEAFGLAPATFKALDSDFKDRFGAEAQIRARLVTQAQCGAVRLLRDLNWGRDQGPQIYLSRTLVRPGQPLAAVVSNVGSRMLNLLLLSDDGRIHDLTASLSRHDDVAMLSVAPPLQPASLGKPQIAIAIAADRPLQSLQGPGPLQAQTVLPRLASELGGSAATPAVAAAYWRYTASPPPAAGGKPWTP